MKKLILLSGGLDSAALFAEAAKNSEDDLKAVFFFYGQKSERKEFQAAKEVAEQYGKELISLSIVDVFKNSDSSLLKKNVQSPVNTVTKGNHTQYVGERTEVEFRNGVFLAAVISLTMQIWPNEYVEILYGATKMREPFADCTKEFVESFDLLAKICSKGKITVVAPYLEFGKDKVLERAKQYGVKIEKTWSCYDAGEIPCGICPACLDRRILGVLE